MWWLAIQIEDPEAALYGLSEMYVIIVMILFL